MLRYGASPLRQGKAKSARKATKGNSALFNKAGKLKNPKKAFPTILEASEESDLCGQANRRRPRISLISPRIAESCHQRVSVRAGPRQTTEAPSREAV